MALRWVDLGDDSGYWEDDGYDFVSAETSETPLELGSGDAQDDYDFYDLIGIDPDSLSDFADSPSNQQILKDIGYTGTDFTLAGVGNFLKGIVSKPGGGLDIGKLLTLGGGALAMGQSNNRTQPAGYQGKIPTLTATRQAPAAGQQISGNVTYAPKMAEGGALESGGFVVPADVVSHLGNGSSEAGLRLLAQRFGATPIKGDGDGMSDSIKTTIDGHQPARVANEEARLTKEQVEAAGGAKKLYAMMDKIRQARTGTKQQGKKIDPSKFMPGGSVQGYATGGVTAPAGTTGTESSLSNWAGDYVTNMMGKGQALSEMPYEQYQGPLTAGASPLQTQAFNQAGTLQTPASIGQAATTAGGIADATKGLSYDPTGFSNQFTAPSAYQTGSFSTGTFGTDQAQQYMNPYLSAALDPQMKELQRQNLIANMGTNAKLTAAGAYGGGRQAVLTAENQRNMMDQMDKTLGQGYSSAYDKAMAQFNADQQRQQQMQKDTEQSRQFGATQGMTGAQLAAQYGTDAQKAAEQSKQFGASYGLDALKSGLQAAQLQGSLGVQENQADIANLAQLASLGTAQRGIESEGIAADRAQFEEARLNPFKMVQFQQSLLSGLPLAAQTYNQAPTDNLTQFSNAATSIDALLKKLGQTST